MTSATSNNSLIELIAPLIAPMGYEVVHLETILQRQKILRIFIDRMEGFPGGAIGIEDCVKVTRALEEPLDQLPAFDEVFKGPYELEVSSPGIDRPLRLERDFERFSGKEARIHVYRALSAEELENTGYQEKNPKQKNFVGVLLGMKNGKVRLGVPSGKKAEKKGKAPKGQPTTNSVEEIFIPFPLISKANLEPKFEEFAERE